MAKAYTKEEVIDAALMRFRNLEGGAYISRLKPMYEKLYDEKGKTEFRKYASVTPETMKEYYASK